MSAPALKKLQLVERINSGRKPLERSIDIVPLSWIKSDKIKSGKDIVVSYYPPYPYKERDKMLEKLSPSKDTWEAYHVKIVGESGKYFFFLPHICINNGNTGQ